MGFLPILDMAPPDLAQDLAADAALARLAVGEKTLVGRETEMPMPPSTRGTSVAAL